MVHITDLKKYILSHQSGEAYLLLDKERYAEELSSYEGLISRFDIAQNSYLGNYFEASVRVGQHTFASSEHAYLAYKRPDIDVHFLQGTPEEAFAYDRTLPSVDSKVCKQDLMYWINVAKFTQHDDLSEKLCRTEGTLLLYENTWQGYYWGDDWVSVAAKVFGTGSEFSLETYITWLKEGGEPLHLTAPKGHNYLGEILMKIRNELISDGLCYSPEQIEQELLKLHE